MTTRRDSLTDYQRWQERIWQDMDDLSERAKTLALEAEVQAVEADPPDPILRDRLRAVGASDDDILYFRLVLRRQAVQDGKSAKEASAMADETLKEYLDKKILRDRSDFEG